MTCRPILPLALMAALTCASADAYEIGSLGLTVTATPTLASDYLFRGISQTRNNWAVQGTVEAQHESGVYLGVFGSTAKFVGEPWNDTRQEVDLSGGWRFARGPLGLDFGYVAYLYPGQDKPGGTQRNEFQELALRTTYVLDPVKLAAAFYYSPNFFGRAGQGFYVEGGADVTLPYGITAIGRLGYQWIERNSRFGTPDYLWYSIGASREVYAGVVANLGWYGTSISRRDCVPVADRAEGGQRICEGRLLFTLSRTF